MDRSLGKVKLVISGFELKKEMEGSGSWSPNHLNTDSFETDQDPPRVWGQHARSNPKVIEDFFLKLIKRKPHAIPETFWIDDKIILSI